MNDEAKTIAKEACMAIEQYYACSRMRSPYAEDFKNEAKDKLKELREELGENVYFSDRDGKTSIICGHKIFYVHNP